MLFKLAKRKALLQTMQSSFREENLQVSNRSPGDAGLAQCEHNDILLRIDLTGGQYRYLSDIFLHL